jgi:hypothetical protein
MRILYFTESLGRDGKERRIVELLYVRKLFRSFRAAGETCAFSRVCTIWPSVHSWGSMRSGCETVRHSFRQWLCTRRAAAYDAVE